MRRAFIVTAFILLVLAGLTLGSHRASAGYRLDGPFTYDNLSLSRVHDGASTAPVPLDIGTTFRQGMIKLHKPAAALSATVDRANDSVLFEWLLSATVVVHPGLSSAPATRGNGKT